MKKVYDIKIDDLTQILRTLKQYPNDPVVSVDIMRLECYIDRLKNNFMDCDDLSTLEQLFNDGDYLSFYRPFYCFSEFFADCGFDAQTIVVSEQYKNIKLSDMSVMDDAERFFKRQGDFFYSSFLDFKNEANNHLKFFTPTSNSSGEALALSSIGEAFVFAPNNSNITKFTILIHELEHVLDFYNNPQFFNSYPIRETAAMFMELLACDYIAEKYQLRSDSFTRKTWIHSVVKHQASLLGSKVEMLDIVNRNRFLNEEKMLTLLETAGFDEDYVKYLLESSITEDFSYQIPYLIAMELYFIYYQNKELALKILQEIIMFGTADNILDILANYNIFLGNSSMKYEAMLFKKFKN